MTMTHSCCLSVVAAALLFGCSERPVNPVVPVVNNAAQTPAAPIVATVGVVTSVVGLIVIRRSEGRVRASYRLGIGLVFNLLAMLVVLFTLFVRGLVNGANAV